MADNSNSDTRKQRVTSMRFGITSLLAVAVIALSIVGTSSCTSSKSAEGSAASSEALTVASDELNDGKLEGLSTVIFDSVLVKALGYDSASDFIDNGTGILDKDNVRTPYIHAEVTDDGSVHVTMSWLQLEQRKLLIQNKIDEAKLPFDESQLSIASDLKTINVSPTLDEAFELGLHSLMYNAWRASIYCMELQVLNHPGDASRSALMRVYDHDSGQLIAEGDMRDSGVLYTYEDWGAEDRGFTIVP